MGFESLEFQNSNCGRHKTCCINGKLIGTASLFHTSGFPSSILIPKGNNFWCSKDACRTSATAKLASGMMQHPSFLETTRCCPKRRGHASAMAISGLTGSVFPRSKPFTMMIRRTRSVLQSGCVHLGHFHTRLRQGAGELTRRTEFLQHGWLYYQPRGN